MSIIWKHCLHVPHYIIRLTAIAAFVYFFFVWSSCQFFYLCWRKKEKICLGIDYFVKYGDGLRSCSFAWDNWLIRRGSRPNHDMHTPYKSIVPAKLQDLRLPPSFTKPSMISTRMSFWLKCFMFLLHVFFIIILFLSQSPPPPLSQKDNVPASFDDSQVLRLWRWAIVGRLVRCLVRLLLRWLIHRANCRAVNKTRSRQRKQEHMV